MACLHVKINKLVGIILLDILPPFPYVVRISFLLEFHNVVRVSYFGQKLPSTGHGRCSDIHMHVYKESAGRVIMVQKCSSMSCLDFGATNHVHYILKQRE